MIAPRKRLSSVGMRGRNHIDCQEKGPLDTANRRKTLASMIIPKEQAGRRGGKDKPLDRIDATRIGPVMLTDGR